MNLRGIDLNLLVILHALLEEEHVSRAARRLGLSQPAASNALERCRHLFGDPLLERAGGVMRRTHRAKSLREPLAALLRDVDRLVDPVPPALERIERTVRIVLADVLAAVLLAPLQAAVAARAPGLTLAFLNWNSGAAALELLANGACDLAVSVLPPADPRRFVCRPVREESYVLAMRDGHPILGSLDPGAWLRYPHVVVSAKGASRTVLDDRLAEDGRTRRVGLTLPSFLLVPEILRGSDFVALLPTLCVAGRRGVGLASLAPPVCIPGFRLDMACHRRNGDDVAVGFVGAEIEQLLSAAELSP